MWTTTFCFRGPTHTVVWRARRTSHTMAWICGTMGLLWHITKIGTTSTITHLCFWWHSPVPQDVQTAAAAAPALPSAMALTRTCAARNQHLCIHRQRAGMSRPNRHADGDTLESNTWKLSFIKNDYMIIMNMICIIRREWHGDRLLTPLPPHSVS